MTTTPEITWHRRLAAVISDTFMFKNVMAVSQAISEWVNCRSPPSGGKPKRVAVGFDTRFMSGDYAELVSRVLAANDIAVLLSDRPIPTPP